MEQEVYKAGDYTITLWKRGLQWHGRVTSMMQTIHTAVPSVKKGDVKEDIARAIGITPAYWEKQEGNGS